MSLILDALRKSDAERQRRARDTLRTGPGPARTEGPPAWLWWLLGAATLGSTVTAVWLALQMPAGGNVRAGSGNSAGIMENKASAEVRPLAQELAVRREADSLAPSPVISDEARTPAPGFEAARDLPQEELPIQATPLAAMPADFRSGLPALEINAHAWAERADQRFALINLRRYEEGDTLREGPRLLRIEQDGVILEFRGERFSLPRQ